MRDLGIYMHIPFCKRKCAYCDFISFSDKTELIEKYVLALEKEIDKCNINKDNYKIKTIYFGGGTPSFIESKYIVEILENAKRKFNISKTAEITIEINPGTITEEKLNKLDKYYDLLIEWNNKINLTRITDKEEVYLKHFYDSLTLIKAYDLN